MEPRKLNQTSEELFHVRAERALLSSTWPKPLLRLRLLVFSVTLLLGFTTLLLRASSTDAQTGWQWYKTDTHVHSSVSADGLVDLGIDSQAAALGYNALFLTDHNDGSSYLMGSTSQAGGSFTANHVFFEDAYNGWTTGSYGSLTSSINAITGSRRNTGVNSVHMSAVSSTYGETYIKSQRGPNFRSGNITLRVAVYPTRIDPGSGVDISVSIGGDPTVLKSPPGYTTQAWVISPGKSTVLIWQLGTTRTPSSNPNARIITYPLTYTLNAWNIYTINVSNALNDIPAADLPVDTAGLMNLKMTAGANNGTVDVFFDTYSLDASAAQTPATEYVNRTGFVHNYDTSSFVIFPSYEMGQTHHSQRFNFGIVHASDYVSYTNGWDGIVVTQQSGYPAMLDHPATSTTDTETVSTLAYGADLLEVREQNMLNDWDAILQQGAQVLGSWSTDAHSGLGVQQAATYIYAPSLTLDPLMQSLFEGRSYNGLNNFTGRIAFNINPASQEPYPARYPIYVPSSQTSADVHLQITSGLYSNDIIKWIVNGTVVTTTNPPGAQYNVTKAIPLSGSSTYVRAEARFVGGTAKGITQPIFFVSVPSLPPGISYNVDKVTTANGRDYTRISTKGITSSEWLAASQALSLTLTNPVGALVTLRVATATPPVGVVIDGNSVSPSATLIAFQAATGSTWFYDATPKILYVKAFHAAGTANVLVNFSSSPTATPTSTSTATATPVSTATNTATSVPTATNTPTDTPTPTQIATFTATPQATDTPTSTSTDTSTPTATPTTDIPTSTNTPTDTATVTPTPANTSTPTNTPTDTPTATSTATNTQVPTNTPTTTSTSTWTPTSTATSTPTSTPTNTPVSVPTNTPTNTATNTATSTPSNTPSVPSIFGDGFESGNYSAWTSATIGSAVGSKLEVIAAAASSGSWGAHLSNGVGGKLSVGSYFFQNFTTPASRILSQQVRIKVNSLSGAGDLRILQLRDQTRQKSVLRVRTSNGVWQLFLTKRDGTTTTANFATSLPLGAWQTLEITYDWSQTQPVGRAYVNGVLQATITDTTAGQNYGLNSIYCMVYEDTITATADIYFDDVRVAAGYIGP
ncbi:MAG: hypothetical protein ABI670_04570 [Chloroflexota bacterium]